MADDTQVKTRHTKKLQTLREEAKNNGIIGEHLNGVTGRPVEITGSSVRGAQGTSQGIADSTGRGTQGDESGARADGRSDQGIRSVNTTYVSSDPSLDPIDRGSAEYSDPVEREETLEERALRHKELNRQRQQRYRDNQRAQSQAQDVTVTSSEEPKNVTHQQHPSFTLRREKDKKPPEEVKLFTEKEVKDELARLSMVYFQASGLLDEILQIIVKGHEEVQIWQMDEGEADTFAEMHLARAKHDKAAARSARMLLALAEKFFIFSYGGPRLLATGRHVKEHGGLSFK